MSTELGHCLHLNDFSATDLNSVSEANFIILNYKEIGKTTGLNRTSSRKRLSQEFLNTTNFELFKDLIRSVPRG